MKKIIIPELEPYRIAGKVAQGNGMRWTSEEEGIMNQYYGYVSVKLLNKYLPNKSPCSIQNKASRMGLTHRDEL